jgi:phosphoribosyl 1,2-cyclic phosphodiesterase
VRHFASGDVLRVGGVAVETHPTPHDGADGVVFVVEAEDRRLGVMTDLGHVFDGLAEVVASLDAVLLESNHDIEMLESGPYPAFLKRRIRGRGGHISNSEAANLVGDRGDRLRWACLAHLSEENNDPALALRTHRDLLCERFPIHVASRYEAGQVLEV